MKERYMIKCAVFLILTKYENNQEYVLLQKRQNTGIIDGQYDVSCTGHLEVDETLTEAMVRETKEELGIIIKSEDLKFVNLMHAKYQESDYIQVCYSTDKFEGVPKIMEPNKCSDLSWFKINDLPKDLSDTRKIMIEGYLNTNNYTEYGFDK
ncbi:MAG: NUDIX domain-containing protein [Bacilli bacterium]|nr:NUDIX domain-containing protein [Bacilli bacterium]